MKANQSNVSETNNLGQPIGQVVPAWSPAEFPKQPPMDGHFCRLEPLDAGTHARGLFAAYARDEKGKNWTYLPYGPFSTFEEYSQWLNSTTSDVDPQFYAVILKSTGEPVGVASFLRIDPGNGSIEVGHIHFSEILKHTPAATEAMFLMMKTAFDLGYRRYEWKCDVLNAASCSAALRLGLSFEGVFRQSTVYKGRNRDTAWFAAVDSDWPELETAFMRWLDSSNFDEGGKQAVSLRELTRPILNVSAFPISADIGDGA